MLYFDNSRVAPPSDRAVAEMIPYFTEKWGACEVPHAFGQSLLPSVEKGYRSLYRLIGAEESDTLVCTSSGAEAVNHAIFSVYERMTKKSGRNQYLVASNAEAPAIMACEALKERDCVVKHIDVNRAGLITAEAVADQMTPRTALLSLSWGDGLTGVMQPIGEISEVCRERGVALHLDATHVLGKITFTLDDLGADLITWSGQPLHAPLVCGAVWIKGDPHPTPLIHGGGEQGGWRAGALNIPSLVAFGVAAEEALQACDLVATHVSELRHALAQGISEQVSGVCVHFEKEERLPHCLTLSFEGVLNEPLLFSLNQKKVYASMGGGNFQQLALLLEASGVPSPIAQSAISLSLSRETTRDEVEKAIAHIVESVKQLRRIRG